MFFRLPFGCRFKLPAGGIPILATIFSSALCTLISTVTAAEKELPRVEFVDGRDNGVGPIVIFVHGLDGDGDTTWLNQHTNASFPALISSDPDFSGVNVAKYYYSNGILSGKFDIAQHATQMWSVLQSSRLTDRELVLVSHSMGGLIARQMILNHPEISEHLQMLFFMSTPFAGSDLARIASLASPNRAVQNIIAQDDGRWLDEQQNRWLDKDRLRAIPSYVAYENQAPYPRILSNFAVAVFALLVLALAYWLRGTEIPIRVQWTSLMLDSVLAISLGMSLVALFAQGPVVNENSASLGANRETMPVDTDHFGICKPSSNQAMICGFFKRAYWTNCKDLGNPQVKRLPSHEECAALITQQYEIDAEALKRPPESPTPLDAFATIRNETGRRITLLLFDAGRVLDPQPDQLGSRCVALPAGIQAMNYLSTFKDPSGWLLLFVRFRDESGAIQDFPMGVFDFGKRPQLSLRISNAFYPDQPSKKYSCDELASDGEEK